MRNFLFMLSAIVSLVSFSSAAMASTEVTPTTVQQSDPVAKLGQIVCQTVIDPTTVLNFHEHGVSVATLNVETSTVEMRVLDGPLPALKMSYVDTSGMRHEVETPFPSINPSARQIRDTIELHKRIVAAYQAAFPPMQPQPTSP